MAKTKSSANPSEKKLRRRLQEAETAALEARQELEAAQERVLKAANRLEKRQRALEEALAALEAAVGTPAPSDAPADLIEEAEVILLVAEPTPYSTSEPTLVAVVAEMPTVDQTAPTDEAARRPRRGRRTAAPVSDLAAMEPAPSDLPDSPLGIIVP